MIIAKNVFMFVEGVLFSKMFSTCSLQHVSSASGLSNQCSAVVPTWVLARQNFCVLFVSFLNVLRVLNTATLTVS